MTGGKRSAMTTEWDLIEGHLILLTNMSSVLGKSVPVGLIGQVRISEQSFSCSPIQLQGLKVTTGAVGQAVGGRG